MEQKRAFSSPRNHRHRRILVHNRKWKPRRTLAGKGSILDPLYEIFNIDPQKFFALGTLGTYAILGICVFAGIVYLYVRRKS